MTAKVIPIKPSKPASPLKVTPEAGWGLHSTYGALKDLKGNPLVRLETVHALFMTRDGLTSMDAAARVFGPFLSDGNSEPGMKYGADKLRPYLMACDPADRAYSLFPASEYADRSHLERLVELVPYVPHHHFDKDTPEALLYALGQMAGEVWAPYSGDVDLNARPCAAFADSYFPTAEKAREILGPFAVRHDLAHKLWGWGTVGAIASADSAASVQPSAPTAVPAVKLLEVDATPAKKLKRYELAPDWTGEKLAKRKAELKALCNEQGKRNYTKVLAKESGLPVREITKRIADYSKGGAMARIAVALNGKDKVA